MSVLLDSRTYADAIKTALNAELGPANPQPTPPPASPLGKVLDYDEVPGANGKDGTQPNIYVTIGLERRYNPNLRSTAQAGLTGWRLTVRGTGRTVDEVRWALFEAAQVLNEKRLTIEGTSTTPIQFESAIEAPKYDDGKFTAADSYTFAH